MLIFQPQLSLPTWEAKLSKKFGNFFWYDHLPSIQITKVIFFFHWPWWKMKSNLTEQCKWTLHNTWWMIRKLDVMNSLYMYWRCFWNIVNIQCSVHVLFSPNLPFVNRNQLAQFKMQDYIAHQLRNSASSRKSSVQKTSDITSTH